MFFMIIVFNKINKTCWIFFCYCNMERNKEVFKNFAMKQKGFFILFYFILFLLPQWWGEKKPHWFFYFVVATHERVKDLAWLSFFVLLVWCVKEGKKTLLFFLFCCCNAWRNKEKPFFFFVVVWVGKGMKEKLH